MSENIRIKDETLSQEAIVKALFENYESIYAVDAVSNAFQCFHQSGPYSSLELQESGEDFFMEIENNIETVYWEDRDLVERMLSKKTILSALKKEKFYSFVYRLLINGRPLYHKLRATLEVIDGDPQILIGIRNIDTAFRQDKTLAEKILSMHLKETNRLEAILASAEGCMEIDLSRDTVLEVSPYKLLSVYPDIFRTALSEGVLSYDSFIKWTADKLVLENRDDFDRICDREYLIECFTQGDRRASGLFSLKGTYGRKLPCRIVFYLYRDASSDDILSFAVLYDLTEQQRKEKELNDLEKELERSRLRNFTSQMQPHFLYNTLGSIQEIILEDPTYAYKLLGDFTVHLRSCIRAMTNDEPIPFEQEEDNIKAYVNIEKMRFGDKLKVVYDIGTRDFLILPLSIQPIVENAIRHGIYERGERGGTLTIRTVDNGEDISVIVEDDGVGFDVEAFRHDLDTGKHDATGLRNIMFRLDIVMGATVDIESCIGTGTRVTVRIRKEESDESDHSR
ncbi:MAG: histidine kinase [Erysipelotrichaceae bacterium]|nr:histidine kinase [Erysipelotrichaceae bacterium]